MSALPFHLHNRPLAARLILEERELRTRPAPEMAEWDRANTVLPFTPPDLNLIRYFRNRR